MCNMPIFEKNIFLILLLGLKNFDRKPPRAKLIKSKIDKTKSCLYWPTTMESEVQHMIFPKKAKSTYPSVQSLKLISYNIEIKCTMDIKPVSSEILIKVN